MSFEEAEFQSPRSGKFVSDNNGVNMSVLSILSTVFQSPRSGKFVSDTVMQLVTQQLLSLGFNPLDRGNLYLICKS